MDEKERLNIIDILKRSRTALIKKDDAKLKELSNMTIHSSSIEQDSDYILIAVVIYALHKITLMKDYQQYKGWDLFYDTTLANLEKAWKFLEHKNEGGYERCLNNILKVGNKLSGNLKKYVKEVMERSKISKGSRVYEHGISLGRSAELLGVSEFELLEYVGKTGISDVKLAETQKISERLNFARGLFK